MAPEAPTEKTTLPAEIRITDPAIIRQVVDAQPSIGDGTTPLTRVAGFLIDRYVTLTRGINSQSQSAAA
jgi:hypothetical protein